MKDRGLGWLLGGSESGLEREGIEEESERTMESDRQVREEQRGRGEEEQERERDRGDDFDRGR